MGPAGGYTIELASGSYKAYVQTNTPGYPDQWVGGSSMADATVVTVSADTTQDSGVGQPGQLLVVGCGDGFGWGAGDGGVGACVRCGDFVVCGGGDDGSWRGLHD